MNVWLKTILKLIPLSFVWQSCVLYPPYSPPKVEVACHWKYAENAEPTIGNIQWWYQFEDPLLTELIAEALHYNKELKVAIYRVAEFYARLGIISSEMFPQLSLAASASKQEQARGTLVGPEPVPDTDTVIPTVRRITDLFSVSANLSYELDFWGRIQSASDAAFADLLAEVQARKNVVLILVRNVARSYFRLRQFEHEWHISKETLTSYAKSYKLAQLRFEEGLTSELEVKQAASLIPIAEGVVVQQELLIAQEENLLSVLVGRVPTEIIRQKINNDWPLPPSIPAGLPAELLLQRPDILRAEQQLISSNAQIGVARAEYFPRISLTGLFGFESFDLKSLFSPASRTWTYGASLVQPLLTGGRIESRVAQAEALKCQAYYNYGNVVLNAFREVEDALIAYRKVKEIAVVEKKRVQVLKQYLELATLQYKNGQTDYLNVLDAERNLFTAQLDLARADSAVYLALVDTYSALGGAWVEEADQDTLNWNYCPPVASCLRPNVCDSN